MDVDPEMRRGAGRSSSSFVVGLRAVVEAWRRGLVVAARPGGRRAERPAAVDLSAASDDALHIHVAPGHLWRVTPEGEPLFFNQRMRDYVGFDAADVRGRAPSGMRAFIERAVHPEDREGLAQALDRSLRTGEGLFWRYRLRRADGVHRWVNTRAEPVRDADGRIRSWFGLCSDIEDQVRTEEALRLSERQLQQLIDALPVHIWSWTPAGELTYVSRRYLDHLGLTEADFPDFARVAHSLVHPDDAPEVERIAAACLRSGDPFVMRYRRRGKDGSYRWMEGRCDPLRDTDGTIVQWYGVSIDIDDAVRAQEELRLAREEIARQGQAASLAELSASIAHEVSQPLAALVANAHACRRWLSAEPPNVERAGMTVDRVLRSANGAAEIVARIRALFQRSAEERRAVPLAEILAEARELMAQEAVRRGVRVEAEIADDMPPAMIDRVQIRQVLINLVRNAIEAMEDADGERSLGLRVACDGELIRIEIRDSGPGIAFPDRIFTPYFTTKRQGMGMGLAICRSIVEAHGGRLWAENRPPRGAAFVFTLPIAEMAPRGSAVALAPETPRDSAEASA